MYTSDDGESEEAISQVEKHLIKTKLDEKEELKEASGLASDRAKGQGKILERIITISEEARQILAMANFEDHEQASLVAACLKEAARYGCSDDMILTWVAAHTGVASRDMSKTEWVVQALTHVDIDQPSKQKHGWKGQKREEKPV